MTRALRLNKGIEQGVLDLLKFLLDSGKVKGVFTLNKINSNGDVSYSIITRSSDLDSAVPFFPLMPANAGKLLSRFTLKGGTKEPIVAVVKPCELRAFVELIKREQGSLENIFFISLTCGGVYPLKTEVDGTIKEDIPKYWDAVSKGEILGDLRPACRGCTEFKPHTADITFDVIGSKDLDKQSIAFLNTEKGEELAKGMKGEFLEKELDSKKLNEFKIKRESEKKKLFDELNIKMNGMDGLIDIFGKCIGCHGCMRVCPICYCKLCEFESPDAEYKPSTFETELKKRGGVRIPPGIIYYQLGRLTHIGISCVGCGACDDVCPMDIPVSTIFKKVGESVQKLFDYVPGRDVEEKIPLVTFEKEEFKDVEE